MKKLYFLILFILFGGVSCLNTKHFSSVKKSLVSKEKYERSFITSRTALLSSSPSVLWTWKSIGPDIKPTENKKAGRSLSEYSFNRGNGAGKIHRLYINPQNDNQIFACSGIGGLFVSEDKGLNWEIAGTDRLPISGVGCITVSLKDSNVWVISTGDPDDTYSFSDGLWITRNAGETWRCINGINPETRFPVSEVLENYTYISEVVSDPTDFNRLFVASNKGLFVTENALDEPNTVEWRLIDDSFYFDIEIPSWEPSTIFASGNRFIRSEDGGATWMKLPLPYYENSDKYKFLRISMELTSSDKNHVYAAVTNNEKHSNCKQGKASFQKFDLDSLKWNEVRSLSRGMNNVIPTRARAFEVNPIDSSLILAANVQPIYRSIDGGKNFSSIQRRQMHDDIHHIEFNSNGQELWAAHDGGVSISFDKGITWEDRDDGIGCAMVYEVSVAQQKEDLFLFGGFDTGGNLYKKGKWTHVLWGDGFKTLINYNNPDTMYVSRQNGFIFRSNDRGERWDKGIKPKGIKAPWYTWYMMNTKNPQTLYSVGEKISRSFDAGDTWETIFDVKKDKSLAIGHRLFLSASYPDLIYMDLFQYSSYSDPLILRSFNVNEKNIQEIKWEKINNFPIRGRISSIVPDDKNPFQFWVTFRTKKFKGGVYFFDGEKWHDYNEGIGNAIIHSMILEENNNGRVYLGTTYGVFTRDRDDEQWTLLKGLPGTYIRSMTINYVTSKIIVGTDGRGLWEGDLFRD